MPTAEGPAQCSDSGTNSTCDCCCFDHLCNLGSCPFSFQCKLAVCPFNANLLPFCYAEYTTEIRNQLSVHNLSSCFICCIALTDVYLIQPYLKLYIKGDVLTNAPVIANINLFCDRGYKKQTRIENTL